MQRVPPGYATRSSGLYNASFQSLHRVVPIKVISENLVPVLAFLILFRIFVGK